ncbi:hypothetical protein HNP84_000031 [Thermocatellispora tengchongensis]|uniref:DUF8094 domain-containing protein n=1 Tax=Thermocatellispora tengchongensis TaxID=1073253 RepID=A0A840NXC0_9ACTN|nr:hypothetical protein [Thermocatellispora tengchongensis]MBB5130343.1 hypothetical protein [Thermocatellispora tengchongensis]
MGAAGAAVLLTAEPPAARSPVAGAAPAPGRAAPGPATAASASPSASPGVRAQLTPAQAARVHDRFQRGLSAAQAAMDAEAIGRYEHGLALEMTRAGIETARMRGEKVPAGMWPKPRVWVPRHAEGRPDWFVAVSHEPGVARISDVMERTRAGWRLVASAADTRATPEPLPAIATDAAGYATSLSQDATGLRGTPRQIVRAHLAALRGMREDPRFADGPWTGAAVRFWRAERDRLERAGWRLSLSYIQEGRIRALRTADGGALVWYSARSTDTRTAERPGALVKLKGAAAVRTADKSFARWASATYGRMYVAYIPPAGSAERVRVMGEWTDLLESDGA